MKNYLEFEKDIKTLEEQLDKLKDPFNEDGISSVNTEKISTVQKEIDQKLSNIYSDLNSWQKTQVARHEDRPKANFFIEKIFTDFINLSGDRYFGDDKSVLAGFAKFENQSLLVIGQNKGNDLESRISHNFGMMRPEGYRKCRRLMKLADKFNIPIVLFVDTPGAYPGVGAEQRGQAEAIAKSIECSLSLGVPTISIIIGEGGSGGAIALASSNKVIMLEHAIYSVISPEGCASILWRDPSKALDAADAMKLTSKDLLKFKIIDEIIPEPTGGAHRDKDLIIKNTIDVLRQNLKDFEKLTREQIVSQRRLKFLNIGRDQGLSTKDTSEIRLDTQKNSFVFINNFFSKKNKKLIFSILAASVLAIILLIYQL